MEAAPRLPMLSFALATSIENAAFGPQLKKYIATFYNEDPESYATEIYNLEGLRETAVRPTVDVVGCQTLKKYYCQLHFLKSRFPMEESQLAAVSFSWKDPYTNLTYSNRDIRLELIFILYNIGALHSQLGAYESRTSPDGMKMACTHFQCAAWAFQTIKEDYMHSSQFLAIPIIHFMQQVCLAQAQECILEKSMLDNRKATIIAKVAVQVYDYYRKSLLVIETSTGENSFQEITGTKTTKDWTKHLQFKVSYNKCISLLFHGQQAEEQQKMGERVAFYQAACELLEEARKLASQIKTVEISEALAFTSDVVEGKRKAAKNENEFIYHEEVPDTTVLQEVKGAALVKGIPFSVNDVEVSGNDIFARLVPMEAHESSSLYSEKKAQMLRQLGGLVESKDQAVAEFMSSMQLDLLTKMRSATGIPQELVDRAAALSARPNATQDLIDIMGKLSNIYHEVESMLNEIDSLLKEEDESEKQYQVLMGKRPPSMIATDLTREAAKYREAHGKANDSNQTLHRAMMTHVANLKILGTPLRQLHQQLPSVELPNQNIDEAALKELEILISKVEEMRTQRAMLWAQFREGVHKDDITSVLVTKPPEQSLDDLFEQELKKHHQLASLIEQNATAQENIKKALVDAYANSLNTRRYVQDVIQKRSTTISALIASYDSYDDLLAKANKGIEFYTKLETNVTKLFQRIKSACKVQQEEREQMLSKNDIIAKPTEIYHAAAPSASTTPKLKDYLDSRKKGVVTPVSTNVYSNLTYTQDVPQASWPPAIRPAPVGSEVNDPVSLPSKPQEIYNNQYYSGYNYPIQNYADKNAEHDLVNRMNALYSGKSDPSHYYAATSTNNAETSDNKAAFTTTTNSYQPISSHTPNVNTGYNHYDNTSKVAAAGYAANQGAYYQQGFTYNVPGYSGLDNNYYPPGYSPQYQESKSANTGYTSGATAGYHSSEYATSVHHPVISTQNNSTYSSPLANTSSSNATNLNYMSSSSSDFYGQNSSGYYGVPSTNPQYTYNTVQPNYATSSDQSYNYGSVAANTQNYPSGQDYNYPQSSTSQTVNFNAGLSNGQSYNYGQDYTNSAKSSVPTYNYATSSGQESNYAPSIGQQSNNYDTSTPAPNVAQQYNYASTDLQYNYANIAPTTNSQNYYGAVGQQYNYANQAYITPSSTYSSDPTSLPVQNQHSYVQNPLPTKEAPPVTNIVTPKESNIDLLTGLDFTINQPALIPEASTSLKPLEPVHVEPTVAKEIKEEVVDKVTPKIVPSKVLNNSEVKKLFNQEVEKYEKYVDVLSNKTLSGPTNLDLKWKEIQDKQDLDGQKRIISVARCYPMKNKFSDILPYDFSRVVLSSSNDDYINASYIKDISPYAPVFIVTQQPISSTFGDFWTMVKEQQVELIFCLLNENEMGDEIYWPKEKGENLNVSNMVISLQSVIVKNNWIERLINITIPEKRESWVVLHLQFTSWPGSLFPTNAEAFTSFSTELFSLQQQQKCLTHPVVVHCSSGIGRSGLLCLLTTAIFDVTNNASCLPDLAALTTKLTNCRKNILRDREHLKFAYEAFLCYMKQIINQEKLKKKLNEVSLTKQEEIKVEVNEIIADPLNSLDPFWASKKDS